MTLVHKRFLSKSNCSRFTRERRNDSFRAPPLRNARADSFFFLFFVFHLIHRRYDRWIYTRRHDGVEPRLSDSASFFVSRLRFRKAACRIIGAYYRFIRSASEFRIVDCAEIARMFILRTSKKLKEAKVLTLNSKATISF